MAIRNMLLAMCFFITTLIFFTGYKAEHIQDIILYRSVIHRL